MSNLAPALETLVDNWLTDVQRRGAELYAENRGNGVLYLSFEGKDKLRFSVKIDFDVQELAVQINSPEWTSVKRENFLLSSESLNSLAKRICLLPEGAGYYFGSASRSTRDPLSRLPTIGAGLRSGTSYSYLHK